MKTYLVILSSILRGSNINVGSTTRLRSAPGRNCDMMCDRTMAYLISVYIDFCDILKGLPLPCSGSTTVVSSSGPLPLLLSSTDDRLLASSSKCQHENSKKRAQKLEETSTGRFSLAEPPSNGSHTCRGGPARSNVSCEGMHLDGTGLSWTVVRGVQLSTSPNTWSLSQQKLGGLVPQCVCRCAFAARLRYVVPCSRQAD